MPKTPLPILRKRAHRACDDFAATIGESADHVWAVACLSDFMPDEWAASEDGRRFWDEIEILHRAERTILEASLA